MKFAALASWALLALVSSNAAATLTVDVYGTQAVSAPQLESDLSGLLKRYVYEKDSPHKEAIKRAEELRVQLEEEVRRKGDFALVRLDFSRDPKEIDNIYLTFEVVERKDQPTRIPFREVPRSHVPDPDGLLTTWKEYSDLGWELVRKGEMTMDRPDCPAFLCTWGSRTPELEKYESRFIRDVPKHKDDLIETLREDQDPERRAAALYLLAYLKDGNEVGEQANYGLLDSDAQVREASMRIYADMAVHNPKIPLPIARITTALDYPSSADRERALAVLLGVAESPAYRPFLIREAMPQILKLLRAQHPSVHHMAHAVLGLVSGKSFGERDYAAWEDWAQKARATADAPPGKKKKRWKR